MKKIETMNLEKNQIENKLQNVSSQLERLTEENERKIHDL